MSQAGARAGDVAAVRTSAEEASSVVTPAARRLLRMPLYFKLIIANTALTLAAVVVAVGMTAAAVRANADASVVEVVWPIIAVTVVIGVLINAVVVRLALTPLRNLVRAAEEIRAGSIHARAASSALSDRDVHHVIGTFNSMLDSVSEYRQRLREIAIRAIDAGEAERKRLSRDLHDGVAQSLAAILLQLRIAQKSAPPATVEALTTASHDLSAAMNELRTMAQGLRPPALDMIGLSAALQAHARNVTETAGVRVETVIEGVDGTLEPESELALYRLVQEALLNVVRHGRTAEARMDVHRENGSVVAVVSDRGQGFDVDTALLDGALGLFGMYERAAYVGGSVTVKSGADQGTVVRIEIPLKDRTHG